MWSQKWNFVITLNGTPLILWIFALKQHISLSLYSLFEWTRYHMNYFPLISPGNAFLQYSKIRIPHQRIRDSWHELNSYVRIYDVQSEYSSSNISTVILYSHSGSRLIRYIAYYNNSLESRFASYLVTLHQHRLIRYRLIRYIA